MVKVLPVPVWPYAKIVPLKPSSTWLGLGIGLRLGLGFG